ncbi:hypothetical protein CFOL_v3_13288 [Cephalotus follicularis]|uniref:Uncharacterized protein n=1 Tax=Cephalotus follicularis TaxID=3775 RepID=A0A1Q3BP15_CEPFO|nr:hypothetical protein CFOL_v3_13288 [Cephalotus follicularis]
MQAFLMWCIISKVNFCYSLLMLHSMVRAFTQKKSVLPFGSILTKIFRHYEINFEGEIGTKLKKEDTYSKSTLNHMGWKKQDGSWIYCPKSDQSQRIDREEHEEIPPWEGCDTRNTVWRRIVTDIAHCTCIHAAWGFCLASVANPILRGGAVLYLCVRHR